MVSSVNTNINAMAAIEALTDIGNQMTTTQNAIESGLKVSTASDNPAVFTIAQGLRANIGALSAVSDSLATGVATVQGQVAGATSISNALNTLLQTVTQSEGQMSAASIAANKDTINNALANIDAYANSSTINGVNLLATTGTLNVLSNVSGSATTVTTTAASTSAGLGLTATSLTALIDGTVSGTTAAISLVNIAITNINATLTNLGSASVQLQGLSDFTSKLSDSTNTGLGAMVDANLSEESAQLSSLQTKQSLAIQSLSLANQAPSSLLQLFR